MKSSLLSIIILISGLNISGQNKLEKECQEMKKDTIECYFVIEAKCKYLYYSTEDFIYQNNSIYPDFQSIDINNPNFLYKKDSVFIYSWTEGLKYYKYKPCVDEQSIGVIFTKMDNPFLEKREKNFYKKSIVKNKDGVEYVRFHAKLIVLNIGEFQQHIPEIYCDSNSIEKGYKSCKKTFKNTLLILKISDFKYSAEFQEFSK